MGAMRALRTCIVRALCAALLFALPAASVAKDIALPPPNPALWRVQHAGATVYLFGSLHILPPGYAWVTPKIEAAMAASNLFVFEVPVDEAALKEEKDFIVENGLLGHRQSLRGVLSSNEFQTYSAVLRRAGLKPEQFERYRPWLAAVVLGLAYLHREDLVSLKGADDDIMTYARAHERPLVYLESIREQMTLLTTGNDRGQIRALKSLIAALPRSRAQEKDLVESWATGDAKRFAGLLDGYFDGQPEARDLLIDRRNRAWLPTIKTFLGQPGDTTMIAVGAAHIGGGKGLIALLCGQGYAVDRVGTAGAPDANACAPGS